MRAIDADALLDQYGLRDATKYGNKNAEQQHKSYGTLMMYEIADMIYDAPTIEPPANWTPCSVALPDIGEEVDVTYQINGKREVGCGKYIGNEQWIAKYGYGHDDEDGEVLAWKPCQEPYRGGE